MSECRFCGKEVTARFGHLATHEAKCSKRPVEPTFKLDEESSEDEPRRFVNANPRVYMSSGITVWRHNG